MFYTAPNDPLAHQFFDLAVAHFGLVPAVAFLMALGIVATLAAASGMRWIFGEH